MDPVRCVVCDAFVLFVVFVVFVVVGRSNRVFSDDFWFVFCLCVISATSSCFRNSHCCFRCSCSVTCLCHVAAFQFVLFVCHVDVLVAAVDLCSITCML